MKELYILRHAKEEFNQNINDYDLHLSEQGSKDAKKIGEILNKKKVIPDLIVSSPALRARETAQIVAKQINYKNHIMYNEVIYEAFLNELIESISYTYDSVNSLLIVGHNPALTALAITFTDFKEELKNSDLIKIEFDCNSWIDIDKNNSKFVEHLKI